MSDTPKQGVLQCRA